MSNVPHKKATFSGPDAAPSGRPRLIRSKPVTEARALAQRQKIDRVREKLQESTELKARPIPSRKPGIKAGSQAMTVRRALEGYIEDQIGGNRSPKTIEWHQTALGLFTTYLDEQEQMTLVSEIDALHITGWFAYLRKVEGGHGKIRSERTIQTYARSVRAFCHWLVRRRLIIFNPFDEVIFPKVGKPLIKILEAEEFERLLWACAPPNEKSPLAERAAVRNRAILWVLYDTGLRVSEL
jgi:site-specific recombinase XerC